MWLLVLCYSLRSAGATLRRYNEGALAKEISELMVSWTEHIGRAVKVFVRAPRHLTQCFTAGKNNPLQHGEINILILDFYYSLLYSVFSNYADSE